MHLGAAWFPRAFGGTTEDGGWAAMRKHFLATAERDEDTGAITKVGGGHVGEWRFDSLAELRRAALLKLKNAGVDGRIPRRQSTADGRVAPIAVTHAVGDVGAMHAQHPGCLFQAASQFNCLEFVSPKQQPEDGITRYAEDRTQGPVCAIACPYATAFRNYLVPCGGRLGQAAGRQLDGLADLSDLIGNAVPTSSTRTDGAAVKDAPAAAASPTGRYWTNTNGYIDSDPKRLAALDAVLRAGAADGACWRAWKDAVRIGTHFGAEVASYGDGAGAGADAPAASPPPVRVGQAFCSALAVGYSKTPQELWETFAHLVLESAYEATLYAAILNHDYSGDAPPAVPTVFLTKLGGGVFGNKAEWVCGAVRTAIAAFRNATKRYPELAMDVVMVHYGQLEAPYADYEYLPTPAPAASTSGGAKEKAATPVAVAATATGASRSMIVAGVSSTAKPKWGRGRAGSGGGDAAAATATHRHVDPMDAALHQGDADAAGDALVSAGYQLVLKPHPAQDNPAFAGIFPAWGARAKVKTSTRRAPAKATTPQQPTPSPSAESSRCVEAMKHAITPASGPRVVLPHSAEGIDPSSRRSTRYAGAWSFTPPCNRCYGYYTTYSTAPTQGRNNGVPPSPARIYSTGDCNYSAPVARSTYPSPERSRRARAGTVRRWR